MEIFIIVIVFIFSFVGIFMYLVIVGASMNISEKERRREDEEQIKYLAEQRNKKLRRYKMERIFIDREWCFSYVLLAIHSIKNSANKERSVEDFLKEIEVMFDIYTDDIELKKIRKKLTKKYAKERIVIA